jgi:hypothetical protein
LWLARMSLRLAKVSLGLAMVTWAIELKFIVARNAIEFRFMRLKLRFIVAWYAIELRCILAWYAIDWAWDELHGLVAQCAIWLQWAARHLYVCYMYDPHHVKAAVLVKCTIVLWRMRW